jgi:hypothetical protein
VSWITLQLLIWTVLCSSQIASCGDILLGLPASLSGVCEQQLPSSRHTQGKRVLESLGHLPKVRKPASEASPPPLSMLLLVTVLRGLFILQLFSPPNLFLSLSYFFYPLFPPAKGRVSTGRPSSLSKGKSKCNFSL